MKTKNKTIELAKKIHAVLLKEAQKSEAMKKKVSILAGIFSFAQNEEELKMICRIFGKDHVFLKPFIE